MGLPLGAIVEVAVVGDIFGQTTMNVWHYKVTTISTTVNPLTEVRDFVTQHFVLPGGAIWDVLHPLLPNEWFAEHVSGQAVAPTRQRRVQVLGLGVGTGGASLTTNLQASLTLQTNLGGRNQIGGKRICMPSSQSDDGKLDVLYTPKMTDLGIACMLPLTEALGNGTYTPVIYHRGMAPPADSNDITGYIVQPQTRTIRRRTVGLGI